MLFGKFCAPRVLSVGRTLVTALQARIPVTQPAVSQHLKVLREARLVRVRAEGTRRLYAVDAAGTAAARAWLARFEDRFTQPLDALATELVRGRQERRRATHRDEGGERAARPRSPVSTAWAASGAAPP